MAYTKTNWVAEVTELSATNFNHMEQGIADAHSALTTKPTWTTGNINFNATSTIATSSLNTTLIFGARQGVGFAIIVGPQQNESPLVIYNSGVVQSATKSGTTVSIKLGGGYGSNINVAIISL